MYICYINKFCLWFLTRKQIEEPKAYQMMSQLAYFVMVIMSYFCDTKEGNPYWYVLPTEYLKSLSVAPY